MIHTALVSGGLGKPFRRANRWPMVLFDNVLARGAFAWSSQTADGFAANALGPQTFDYWTPTSGNGSISVTLGAAEACDCAAVVAHDLGTKGSTVHLEYRTGTAAWTALASATPTDDSTLLLIGPPVVADQWRLRVAGASPPSLGVVMIGRRQVWRVGVTGGYVALPKAKRVELLTSTSRGGQFLGNRIVREEASTDIGLSSADRDWVNGALEAFRIHYDEGKPFIWASDPGGDPDDVGYCWRAGDELRPAYTEFGIAEFSLSVSAYAA